MPAAVVSRLVGHGGNAAYSTVLFNGLRSNYISLADKSYLIIYLFIFCGR